MQTASAELGEGSTKQSQQPLGNRGMASPKLAARLAGLAYLVTIVTGLFAELAVRGNVIVSGDAAATARNVVASHWRISLRFFYSMALRTCALSMRSSCRRWRT